MSKRIFTVPNNYTTFKCKAGECTKTCCHGWHITISMREYYALLGLDCSEELRRKLDGGIYLLESPSNERYAEFAKNYFGDCKMHGENGLCTIQCECGEDCLPSVCRYYPRSPRTFYADECSVSASCEAVSEMLLKMKEPMTFKQVELDFKYELPDKRNDFVSECYVDVRKAVIARLQDRTKPFDERIDDVVKLAKLIAPEMKKNSHDRVNEAIAESCGVNINAENATDVLSVLKRIFARLSERFQIDKYAESVNNITDKEYKNKAEKFASVYPEFDTMAEQLFVNHVFYTGFPFVPEYGARFDTYSSATSLALLYAVWKTAVVSCMNDMNFSELVDVTSDIFKMAETSNYYLCAAVLVRDEGYEPIEKLISLYRI